MFVVKSDLTGDLVGMLNLVARIEIVVPPEISESTRR